MNAFLASHPVLSYFALTFAISWSGVLLVIGGPGAVLDARAETSPVFAYVFLAMVAGPSVAGVLLTALVHGRVGLREYFYRLVRWRVGARWYAIALIAAPLLATTALLAFSLVFPGLRPAILVSDDRAGLLLFGIAVGVGAGIFEELGWTGFAIPELRRRHGVLATGLIVGLLWGAWHILVVVWGIGDRAGALPLPLFIVLDTLSFLPAFRVLMAWVYDRTESLLVGMLMHVSLTATTLTLWPVTIGGPLVAYDLVVATVAGAVVAAVAAANSGRLSRQAFRARTA